LAITWSFSYSYSYANIKSTTEKKAPASQAILMAMQIRRHGAEHIAQYSRSRATLNATGCHHRAIILFRIAPADTMVIDFSVKK
jgi:hypothetical protein